jgi:predicted Rossmann fold flavoprotein
MKNYDVIIIGAGAAGLMCAIEAGKRGRKVLLIDHAKNPAEKIRISGGGRCNFTNLYASPQNYLSQNPRFCISALKRFTQHDFIALVKKHNIAYHEKTLGQLFCDGSAMQIIQMLLDEAKSANVEIRLSTKVLSINKNAQFEINTEGGILQSESLVIATGGKSIPKMGATGFGYDIAKQFGLNIIEPRAALAPFLLNGEVQLAGLAVDAVVSCNKTTFPEAILFTHRGLSGPAILQISSYWQQGDTVAINLAPKIDVFAALKEAKETNPKQELATILARFLPKRLAQYKAEGFCRMADISHKNLAEIAASVNNWQVIPSGTEGFRTAEVTIGGVDTDELSSKTFEANKVKGLYFIGEVVDVTGHLGGFNFQWAWASGYAAGLVV